MRDTRVNGELVVGHEEGGDLLLAAQAKRTNILLLDNRS